MRYKILISGFLFCLELLAFVSLSRAASGSQKVKIIYAAISGAYIPFWIAVEESLGRKYNLELESIYAGRTNTGLILASGEAQYSVGGGFGAVHSYALGEKDRVIIVSFANSSLLRLHNSRPY